MCGSIKDMEHLKLDERNEYEEDKFGGDSM